MARVRRASGRSRAWSALASLALVPVGCSVFAPPDSELVGQRPDASQGGAGATGGAGAAAGDSAVDGEGGVAGSGEQEMGGNSPGKPVPVGTPTGDWSGGSGLRTRFADDVDPTSAHADYPRPHLTRRTWATLNGLWDYEIDASAESAPPFTDAKLLVPFPLESKLSGVQAGLLDADSYLWYRRRFTLPAAWRGQRVLLHFGAVDWDASVRVNGTEVVSHQGGYDSFSVDITDQLAAADEQELIVRVADPSDSGSQPRGKQALVPTGGVSLSSVSGIWQSVWLEPVPVLSIQNVQFVGDPSSGVVSVEPKLTGAGVGTTLRAIVSDAGVEVARGESKDGAAFDLTLPAPIAWTPDEPHLYDVTLELEQDGVVIDSVGSYFGLRSIALGQDAGVTKVLLNGQPYVGVGVLYQGYWPEGLYTPPTDAAIKADLSLVKNLGFNSVRVHEKVESERFYYWADQLGLLVWQDMPAGDNSSDAGRSSFSAELSAVVSERSSHPSLAVWTLFTGSVGQKGADVGKLVQRVKTLTSRQLVIGAAGVGDDGSGDIRDRPDAGYVTSPVPDQRAVALGTFGSLARPIAGHVWSGNGAAVQTEPDTDRYVDLARRARGLARRPGLSTFVYRQLTDVEAEVDGLVTYDRQVTKIIAKTAAAANTGTTPPITPLVQASEFEVEPAYVKDAQIFRYTTSAPGATWQQPGFDDKSWMSVPAGIGNTADAGARIRTLLSFDEIWARTRFVLDEKPRGRLIVRMMHDEDTQVYVNNVRAADAYTWTTKYGDFWASEAAGAALVKGTNTIAVHTHNISGGRYVDVGLWITDDAPAYRAPDAPAATEPGLDYFDYDLSLTSLPADLSTNPARGVGVATSVGQYVPALPGDNARALRLHGYIEVTEDGIYTFYVDTDDGARLSIGQQRVAEAFRNDGVGITKRAGNIALAKGKHELTIDYFANDDEGASNNFGVAWSGPGFANQQSIPAANLSH